LTNSKFALNSSGLRLGTGMVNVLSMLCLNVETHSHCPGMGLKWYSSGKTLSNQEEAVVSEKFGIICNDRTSGRLSNMF